MSQYADDAVVSAREKAAEAARDLFRERLEEFENSGGCSVYSDAAQGAYAAAAEALFSGTKEEWFNAMAEGAFWEHIYNQCLATTLKQ